jgi:membrane protein required for colicin V production
LHEPVRDLLVGPVGTVAGASVLAFALVFGTVFIAGKLASRRVGGRVRRSVVGPLDRVLGAGFGALKGLIGATVLFLTLSLVYDTIWGRAAERPAWMTSSRSYPLLKSSGATIVDLVEAQRGPAPQGIQSAGNGQ